MSDIDLTEQEKTFIQTVPVDRLERELQAMIGMSSAETGMWVDHPIPLALGVVQYGVLIEFSRTAAFTRALEINVRGHRIFVVVGSDIEDPKLANRAFAAAICVALRRCTGNDGGRWKAIRGTLLPESIGP